MAVGTNASLNLVTCRKLHTFLKSNRSSVDEHVSILLSIVVIISIYTFLGLDTVHFHLKMLLLQFFSVMEEL